MIAKFDRGSGAIAQETEDLRGFAIEAFAEYDIRRNRMLPPIVLHAALRVDIAHGSGATVSVAICNNASGTLAPLL
jgi:hypothetical protein